MPTQLSLRLENNDRIRSGLNRFAQAVGPLTREIIHKAMELALKKAIPYRGGALYDIPETGGGYVRTGNLGRSSYVQQDGLTTTIKVEAYRKGREYGRYVTGNAEGFGQARVHVGRWPKLRTVVDEQVDELTQKVDDGLQKQVNREELA